MANLQNQSDAAFRDEGFDSLQDEADGVGRGDENFNIQFAEDPDVADDDPAPPPLQSDGQAYQAKPPEFADDESNQGPDLGDVADDIQRTAQQRTQAYQSNDIHSRTDAQFQSDPQQGLSDVMVQRAQMYGMLPAQARAMYKTDAELRNALIAMDQQLLQQQQFRQQAPPQQTPQQQPMQPQQQTPTEVQLEAYKLNEEMYEEPLLADLQGMQDHQIKMFQQMHQQIQGLQQYVHQQIAQQRTQALRQHVESFDKAIQGLGDDWSDVFGRGSYQEINRNSAEAYNRGRVLNTVDAIMQQHAVSGRNVDMLAALESALQITFPDRQITSHPSTQQSEQSSPGGKQQPRNDRGQFMSYTNRPNGRSDASRPKNRLDQLASAWDQISGSAGDGDDGMI